MLLRKSLDGMLLAITLASCSTDMQALQKMENREFRRALTNEELSRLQAGETVTKTHRNYTSIWKKGYQEGPLRITQTSKRQFAFTPFGEWKQVEEGQPFSSWVYTGIGREYVMRIFSSSAGVAFNSCLIYTVSAVLDGDSVREQRMVYFRDGNTSDTLAVQHWYSKNGKYVKKEMWSYDTRGLHPVPPGWRLGQ